MPDQPHHARARERTDAETAALDDRELNADEPIRVTNLDDPDTWTALDREAIR